MHRLGQTNRYIVCSRVTKRPVFVFLSTEIHPSDALQIFTFEDDYSFGILQSIVHWEWFIERCSTLTNRFRYTSNTVYDSFPWPQKPTLAQVRKVAKAAVSLRELREQVIFDYKISLRELYRTLELPGDHPLKDAHKKLDNAVRLAYGMGKRDQILDFLFELNGELAHSEESQQPVVGPGLPPCVKNIAEFITDDCLPLQIIQTTRSAPSSSDPF